MYILYKLNEPQPDLRTLQCETGPLREVMRHSHIGELADYIGKECIFYQEPADGVMPKFERRTRYFLHELVEDHNFNYDRNTFDNIETACGHLRKTLEKGDLTLAYLDAFHLPFTPLYQTEHHMHCLIVNGYNQMNNTVYVYDTAYRIYNREISRDAFSLSWKTYNYKKIDIPCNQNLKELDQNDFIQVISTNLKSMASINCGQVGFVAMNNLKEVVGNFDILAPTNESKFELYDTIHCIAEQTELHSLFLLNMGKRFHLPILEIANDVKYIAQEWMIVKNILIKSSFKDTVNLLQRACNKITGIIEKEERYLQDISRVLSL